MKRLVFFLSILIVLSCATACGDTWHADAGNIGSQDGTSWEAAYASVEAAIDVAGATDEVCVAEVTYAESVTLADGTSVHGGFAETKSNVSEGNAESDVTTIYASTAGGGGLAEHAVVIEGIASSRLAGFTVTGGNADGSGAEFDIGADGYYADDAYEENDWWSSYPDLSFDLSGYGDIWLSEIDGSAVQADPDWYEIYVPWGHTRVFVDCRFTQASGDIDIGLYDPETRIWSGVSSSTNDNEYIDCMVPSSGGTYYICVWGDNAGNTYDMWWQTDDYYEQNDWAMAAYDLSAYESVLLSEIDGYGVQVDPDWYEIYVAWNRSRVFVECQFSYADGSIYIGLYDPVTRRWWLASIPVPGVSEYYLNCLVPRSGSLYYVCVWGDNAGNAYDLVWEADDYYDENDWPGIAYDLSGYENVLLSSIGGYGVQADPDWYEIEVTPDRNRVWIWCPFTHADGNIDIGLYDAVTKTWPAAATSETDDESIARTVSAGTYYICVWGDNSGNTYDLWFKCVEP